MRNSPGEDTTQLKHFLKLFRTLNLNRRNWNASPINGDWIPILIVIVASMFTKPAPMHLNKARISVEARDFIVNQASIETFILKIFFRHDHWGNILIGPLLAPE